LNHENRNDMKLKLSFLLSAVCLLLLPACSESELPNKDGEWPGVNLNPGEKAVMFTLEGTGSGAASTTRATDEVTLPGETDIEKLDIYCFTGASADASFTLERSYHYSKAGTANDFLLIASAGGYKLGIGVPENDANLRRFLIIANDNAATRTVNVSITTYNDVLTWLTAAVTTDVTASLSSPFPMTSRVPKPVLMNDGSYTYKDEPFSAADLVKGVNVRMQRRVARLDIENPVSEYFEVTGINVNGYADYGLFEDSKTSDANVSYGPKACENAANIPGAFYCYPGGASSSGTTVTIQGKYLGAETTITTAGTQLLPNTRYIVRIHDSNHNLSATLEVVPWDEGGEIEAPVTPGTYATTVNVSVPYVLDANERPYAYIDKTKRIIRVAYDWLKYDWSTDMGTGELIEALIPNPFLQLKGEDTETAPVGVILSDALKGRVEVKYSSATGITTLELIPTAEEKVDAKKMSGLGGLPPRMSVSSPASITFVTQTAAGGVEYEEWTLIEDCFQFRQEGMLTRIRVERKVVLGVSSDFPTLQCRVNSTLQTTSVPQATGTVVTLSPYCYETCLMLIPVSDNKRGNINADFYLEAGQDWLLYDMETFGTQDIPIIYAKDNDTGQTRETTVVVRRAADDSGDTDPTTGGMEELRYRIVQPSITNATQTGLASSAGIRLESLHTAEELSMAGNTIYMDFGTYSDDSGGFLTRNIVSRIGDYAFPFSLLTEGRKPVRVLIPADCDWLTESPHFVAQTILGEGGMESLEPTPGNFLRQFVVTPNKTLNPRSVTFRVETYANGRVVSTAYTLVQQPTKKGESGGGIM